MDGNLLVYLYRLFMFFIYSLILLFIPVIYVFIPVVS